MSDLQELFSRLKAQSSDPSPSQSQSSTQPSIWAQPQQQQYLQPSVSSPIFSPPAHTPNPIHSSSIISPVNPASAVGSPGPDQNRTNNLLNLLKFNNQGSQAGPMANLQNVGGIRTGSMSLLPSEGREAVQARPLSAQDLMASLQRKPSGPGAASSPMTAAGAEKSEPVTSPSSSSKDFLLNLLNKPKETKAATPGVQSQTESTKQPEGDKVDQDVDDLAHDLAESSIKTADQQQTQRESTPVRHFGSADAENTAFEAPQPTKTAIFSYVNPFDQLHSSSPLNHSPKPDTQAEPKKIEILKHNREISSTLNGEAGVPAAKSRKITSEDASSPSGLHAESGKSQSVSEALAGVGEKVDKEADEALAQADAQEKGPGSKIAPADTGDNAADDSLSKKEAVAEDDDEVASSWETGEEEEAGKEEDFKVEVYNFPMKPFVSIQIKEMDSARPIRQDNFMHIAKLKKDFDQIDRCLVTASQTHIVYAETTTKKDNGGFRIIRQDTGDHKQVFRSSGERVFSVQLCNIVLPGNDVETVLGTGVNGSVFWTSLSKSRGELFSDDDVEAQGFIMPPVATPEEQTSGSPVKTRAKMSSRHPEYFGVARGKQIHIIAPETVKSRPYCNMKTRKINSEKYLAEHGLKIMTGKAGKDFCFSEDDTMIVSLDKSGRVKFWDIKELTTRATDISEGKHEPVELREPVWSLAAAASGSKPDEKPSVSSIMFLDKERPTVKGVALRYMLVGFKQNHILQLWDLGLGKAVQEICLPHEKDSDGICSVTYHPRSGIIALGHPTRNSIYFVHLSAPKYTFAHMDQAKYINLLARGDSSLPRPESTAIMSGLREFSFAKVGQLRSLDMLRYPVDNASDPDSDDATLFELYIYHSKGVVGMSVKRKDLGWDKDSKMVKPLDAVQAGIIEVKDLVPPQKLAPPSGQSSNAETPAKQIGKTTAASKKHEPAQAPSSAAGKEAFMKRESAFSPAPEQSSRQISEAPMSSQQPSTTQPTMAGDSYAAAVQRGKSPTRDRAVLDAANAAKKITSPTATAAALHTSGNDDLQAMLTKQFDSLYQRIDADKRVLDAAGSAKQDAVLRLVSSTLAENVESSLKRIVSGSMEKEIVPAIANSTSKTVEKKMAEVLPQQLNVHVSREVKAALPNAIQQALKDPQVNNTISNQVAAKVQQQVAQLLQQSMPNIATQATQKMVTDLENRTKQQLREVETRRQQDNAKIQELSSLVRGLTEMIQNMSETQAAFQEQILKMQRPSSKAGTREEASAASAAVDPQKEAEEQEVAKITQLLVDGHYDAATMEWLQSNRQGELFDQIFVRVNPQYLQKVTPLLALSVSAAATASFENNVEQRLEWLATIVSNVNLSDPDINDVAPKIMDVLSQRLQGAYMNISEVNPNEPSLRRISALNKQVVEVRRLAG